MKSIFLTLALTTMTATMAHADPQPSFSVPSSPAEYCEMAKDLKNFQTLAGLPDDRLAFNNRGGLLNGGTCWWHSLFQRASFYLAVYRPELAKPSEKEAKAIIDDIAEGKKVVEIPGYKNMSDFSYDHYKQIQKKLERWQKVDAFLNQKWVTGLSGQFIVSQDELSQRMDALYDEVTRKRVIVYQMLQERGIGSHSMLVHDMVTTPTGYLVNYIDSSKSHDSFVIRYDRGEQFLNLPSHQTPVVGYTQRESDLKNFAIAILRYCNPKVAAAKYVQALTQIRDGGGASDLTAINHAISMAQQQKFTLYRSELTLENDESFGEKFTQLMNEK